MNVGKATFVKSIPIFTWDMRCVTTEPCIVTKEKKNIPIIYERMIGRPLSEISTDIKTNLLNHMDIII